MTKQEKHAAYMREWNKKNPEKVREIKRRYRNKHKETCNATRRRWKMEHPEKWAESRRRWRESHKEAAVAHRLVYMVLAQEKPSICSMCGSDNIRIVGHHADYSKPLDVRWVCYLCHTKIHLKGSVAA